MRQWHVRVANRDLENFDTGLKFKQFYLIATTHLAPRHHDILWRGLPSKQNFGCIVGELNLHSWERWELTWDPWPLVKPTWTHSHLLSPSKVRYTKCLVVYRVYAYIQVPIICFDLHSTISCIKLLIRWHEAVVGILNYLICLGLGVNEMKYAMHENMVLMWCSLCLNNQYW